MPIQKPHADSSPAAAPDVFIYISGNLVIEWTSEAYRAVVEFGMTPFFYQGLEKAHEGSSVIAEAQNDLWECDLIILALATEEAERPEALWIHDQVDVAIRRGVPVLAYVYDAPSKGTERKNFGHFQSVLLVSVDSPKSFGGVLTNDLRAMRGLLNQEQ